MDKGLVTTGTVRHRPNGGVLGAKGTDIARWIIAQRKAFVKRSYSLPGQQQPAAAGAEDVVAAAVYGLGDAGG